jgi:hypothetical protein
MSGFTKCNTFTITTFIHDTITSFPNPDGVGVCRKEQIGTEHNLNMELIMWDKDPRIDWNNYLRTGFENISSARKVWNKFKTIQEQEQIWNRYSRTSLETQQNISETGTQNRYYISSTRTPKQVCNTSKTFPQQGGPQNRFGTVSLEHGQNKSKE